MLKVLGKPLPCSIAVVTFFTLLFEKFSSAMLFYLLFPGLALGLMITGGHGGTHFEDSLAPVVGLAVNIIVYWVLFRILLFVRTRWKEKRQTLVRPVTR
jgi:hypothetical protein